MSWEWIVIFIMALLLGLTIFETKTLWKAITELQMKVDIIAKIAGIAIHNHPLDKWLIKDENIRDSNNS